MEFKRFPFDDICEGLARDRVGVLAGAHQSIGLASIRDASQRLSLLLSPTLHSLFSSQCSTGVGALSRLFAGRNRPELPGDEYRRFAERMVATGCMELFDKFPHAKSLVERNMIDWQQCLNVLHDRYVKDRSESGAMNLSPGASSGLRLFGDARGDSHYAGSFSAVVMREDQEPIVYKPRIVANDKLFGDIAKRVYSPREFSDGVPLTVDRGSYGWQTFLSSDNEMEQLADVGEYFARCGQALFLSWVCSGNDCHSHNLIANSRSPHVVDCETFFGGHSVAFGPRAAEFSAEYFLEELCTSGFFPIADMKPGAKRLQNNPVFCDGRSYEGAVAITRWSNINTDLMAPYETCLFDNSGSSKCSVRGRVIDPIDFSDQIVDGFLRCREQIEHEGIDSIVLEGASKSTLSRLIIRDTLLYDTFLVHSLGPNYMLDVGDRECVLDRLLARGFPDEEFSAIREYERSQLMQGYIPRFWMDAKTGAIFGDDECQYYVSTENTSASEFCERRLRVIASIANKKFDELIRKSLVPPTSAT